MSDYKRRMSKQCSILFHSMIQQNAIDHGKRSLLTCMSLRLCDPNFEVKFLPSVIGNINSPLPVDELKSWSHSKSIDSTPNFLSTYIPVVGSKKKGKKKLKNAKKFDWNKTRKKLPLLKKKKEKKTTKKFVVTFLKHKYDCLLFVLNNTFQPKCHYKDKKATNYKGE